MTATRLLHEHRPETAALRDVSSRDLAELGAHLPEPVRSRARHVVAECERVLEAATAMRANDAERLGALMNASMRSSRDLFENSGPALEAMWDAGNGHAGCLGGRPVGAGFAGCLVFLVRSEAATDFVAETTARFAAFTGLTPDLYVAHAADGAAVVPLRDG